MKRPSPPDLSMSRSFAALRAQLKALEDAVDPPSEAADPLKNVTKDLITNSPAPISPELCIEAWVPEPIARYLRERYEAVIAAGVKLWLLVHQPEAAPPEPIHRPREYLGPPPVTGGWWYMPRCGRWGYFWNYENLGVIARLAGHQCMRLFYREICKDAGNSRIEAVIKLLDAALHAADVRITPPTIAEAEQHYQELQGVCLLLLEYAYNPCFNRADSDILYNTAMLCSKRGAERYRHEMKFATPNKSYHSRDRMLVIKIGSTMQRLFPKSGHEMIARLATAVVGHPITKSTVQTWVVPVRKKANERKELHTRTKKDG